MDKNRLGYRKVVTVTYEPIDVNCAICGKKVDPKKMGRARDYGLHSETFPCVEIRGLTSKTENKRIFCNHCWNEVCHYITFLKKKAKGYNHRDFIRKANKKGE